MGFFFVVFSVCLFVCFMNALFSLSMKERNFSEFSVCQISFNVKFASVPVFRDLAFVFDN